MGMQKLGRTLQRVRRRVWDVPLCRRNAILVVFVVLSLEPGASLLCIIHCDLWLPSVIRTAAMHHDHHHMGMTMPGALVADGSDDVLVSGALLPPCGMWLHRSTGTTSPFVMPPTPIRDVLLLLGAVLIVVFVCVGYPIARAEVASCVFRAAPFRPPIFVCLASSRS